MSCSIASALTKGQRTRVSVNGVVIGHDLISRETQNHPASSPALAWTAASRALVVRELLVQEARRIGIEVAPLSDGMGRSETETEALVRCLIERQVHTPTADEATCRRYYEANSSRFRSGDIFECAHILIAARQDDREASAVARERAEALLSQLRERPDDFAALASAHSDCPSRAVAGNLGQVTLGMTTLEFEAALGRLTPGEVSGLIESRYGVHIIRLDRRICGQQLPFEHVHGRIECYLAERSKRTALAQYIALLASRAEVSGVDLPTPANLSVH
jgi:peptidyl-prolyl cis-trans isomerase C